MSGNINSLSRSEDDKRLIRSLWSPPVVIDGFLTDDELTQLKASLGKNRKSDKHQSGGKKSLSVSPLKSSDLPLSFQRKLKRALDNFRIRSLFAFDSNTPFMLHTDASLDNGIIPYKNMTFCLEENLFDEQLVLYNARSYFSVSINNHKDFVYSEDVVRNYQYLLATPEEFAASPNAQLDSSAVEIVSGADREHLIRHIDPAFRSSFKIVDKIRFEKNRMIIFDSCQLHSGSSLRPVETVGTEKRMIIFTEYRKQRVKV